MRADPIRKKSLGPIYFFLFEFELKNAKKTIIQIIIFLALRFLFFQVISRKIIIHSIDIKKL